MQSINTRSNLPHKKLFYPPPTSALQPHYTLKLTEFQKIHLHSFVPQTQTTPMFMKIFQQFLHKTLISVNSFFEVLCKIAVNSV